MNPMAMIGARLQVLEALEAENVKLRAFIERVSCAYDIAEVQTVLHEAHEMARHWV